jgi:cell division protein FtsQ
MRWLLTRLTRCKGWRVWAVPPALAAIMVGAGLAGRIATTVRGSGGVVEFVLAGSAALGLTVADVVVEGRATTARETILNALGAKRGTPILGIDLERARARLLALPWVSSATVMRRLPDTLYVRLVERRPLALWQHDGKIELIDRDGGVIPVKELGRFARLPLVVGPDAAQKAAELLDMLAREPELAPRVTAAVRVGGRRWNLRIDDAVDVLLPEARPDEAWARLARLEHTQQLLERQIEAVDMRLPDRLVLQLPARSAEAKKGRQPAKNI